MELAAKSGPQEVIWEAVVIRKDGSKEDLGTIAYWHKNPLKRILFRLRGGLRRV